ncbi:MAG: 30S ribosomal protein S5 [Treponema sp.]|nr:30S ribosomal protein S5 [Treponema sp.]
MEEQKTTDNEIAEKTTVTVDAKATESRFEGRAPRERRGGRENRGRERDDDFVEKLVELNRTAKVVKGGRRFSFAALTVVGDKKGHVGFGFGKANDVTEAIRKSIDRAKRNLVTLPMIHGTVPHDMIGNYKSSSVMLKPARPGTGIIAGGAVRAIMDAAGATDIISKSLGSRTNVNVVRATFDAIAHILDAKAIAQARGKTLNELWG